MQQLPWQQLVRRGDVSKAVGVYLVVEESKAVSVCIELSPLALP